MKTKSTCILIVIAMFFSCSKSTNPQEYVQYIEGYWEIDRVVFPNGTEKKYSFNQTIDFFEVNDSIGIRKKVQPQLNGNFIVTNDNTVFKIKVENDSLRLFYNNDLSDWKETIISAGESNITIKNESGNVYFYRPYKKIEL